MAVTDVDAIINPWPSSENRARQTFEEINFRGTANLVDAPPVRLEPVHPDEGDRRDEYPGLSVSLHEVAQAETYVRDRIADRQSSGRRSSSGWPSPEHHFQFIAQLADLLRQGPLVPIPGDGGARFQPIHTDDVAGVFAGVLDDPSAYGQTLEIAGPETLTYREMMDEVARTLEISKPFVNVPIPLVRLGARILTYMPLVESPVTPGQLDMLQIDNTTDVNAAESILNRPLAPFRGGLDFLRNLDEVS
ncbi:MAG: hypothetical protein R2849_22145 [Thermomicrobiales bacterium]